MKEQSRLFHDVDDLLLPTERISGRMLNKTFLPPSFLKVSPFRKAKAGAPFILNNPKRENTAKKRESAYFVVKHLDGFLFRTNLCNEGRFIYDRVIRLSLTFLFLPRIKSTEIQKQM